MPSSTYILTPRAEDDINAIWDYTASEWGVMQAETYIDGLFDKFEAVAAMPDIYPVRTEYHPPLLLISYKSHVIAMRLISEKPNILRVLHKRQDIPGLVSGED